MFAAGDSDTDVAFVQDATDLKLVIDRHRVQLMCNAESNAGGRWIVQPMFIDPLPRRAEPYPCATTLDAAGQPLLDEEGRRMSDQGRVEPESLPRRERGSRPASHRRPGGRAGARAARRVVAAERDLLPRRPAPPTLELVRTRATPWAAGSPATRTIEMSRPLVSEQPWGAVVEVLKHEMAHQYVHEVLRRDDETPHGAAFQEACARLGIDARAAGMPETPAEATDGRSDRIVERIARLLALAESPNVHEAEAAMAAAQRLMLKHNLEVVALARGARTTGYRHLGKPTGRVSEAERLLAMILGKHFFVEVIWIPVYRPLEGKRGSVLEVCGTPANLEMADVRARLPHQTAERLWREHKARGHPHQPRPAHLPRRRHGGLR